MKRVFDSIFSSSPHDHRHTGAPVGLVIDMIVKGYVLTFIWFYDRHAFVVEVWMAFILHRKLCIYLFIFVFVLRYNCVCCLFVCCHCVIGSIIDCIFVMIVIITIMNVIIKSKQLHYWCLWLMLFYCHCFVVVFYMFVVQGSVIIGKDLKVISFRTVHLAIHFPGMFLLMRTGHERSIILRHKSVARNGLYFDGGILWQLWPCTCKEKCVLAAQKNSALAALP